MKVDFFIVGAPKAGTTSLYHYLNEHLEVEMSSQKEPDYFLMMLCMSKECIMVKIELIL